MLLLRQIPAAGPQTDRRSERSVHCDECVEICAEIIDEELEEAGPREHKGGAPDFEINLLTPEEMKAFLTDYVIGQDEAKKVSRWQCTIITNELWQIHRRSMWNCRRATC